MIVPSPCQRVVAKGDLTKSDFKKVSLPSIFVLILFFVTLFYTIFLFLVLFATSILVLYKLTLQHDVK